MVDGAPAPTFDRPNMKIEGHNFFNVESNHLIHLFSHLAVLPILNPNSIYPFTVLQFLKNGFGLVLDYFLISFSYMLIAKSKAEAAICEGR